MTSCPVLPPSSSRASTSAISSGVTNSICSPVVIALNSSSEKMPFSPVSMKTLLSVWPVAPPREGSSGRKDAPGTRASASPGSKRATGRPARRISPKPMRFQAMAAAGLISLVMGPGRPRHQEEQERAPRQRALGEEGQGGFSSEWV